MHLHSALSCIHCKLTRTLGQPRLQKPILGAFLILPGFSTELELLLRASIALLGESNVVVFLGMNCSTVMYKTKFVKYYLLSNYIKFNRYIISTEPIKLFFMASNRTVKFNEVVLLKTELNNIKND
jgi:hypothetical protein